jgi:tape measure domain-containing protein
MEQQRKMFEQTNMAITALGLNSERAKLTMLAIGQMASKGVVSMEELRRQLGDSIPGAFSLAARAMGVTQAQLNQMVSTGTLASEVFLPRFAAQLEKEFGGAIAVTSQATQANINRITNSFIYLKLVGGQIVRPLIKEIAPLADRVSEWSKKVEINSTQVIRWAEIALKAVKILAIYKTAVFLASKTMIGFNALQSMGARAMLQYRTNLAIARIETTAFDRATKMAMLTWRSFSLALKANVIGLAVTGISLLITKLMQARDKANEAKLAQSGYNDELERTSMIARTEAINKFLTSSGIMYNQEGFKMIDASKEAFEKFNEYVRNSGVEELRTMQSMLQDEESEIKRRIANIQESAEKSKTPKQILGNLLQGPLKDLRLYDKYLGMINSQVSIFDKANKGSTDLNFATETANNIISGGSRPTNITINLQKLNEKIEVSTTNLSEGVKDIENQFIEMFLRVLNSSQKLAVQ